MIVVLLVLAGVVPAASAELYKWQGDSQDGWGNRFNWRVGPPNDEEVPFGIPGATDDVLIRASASALCPILPSTVAACANLTVESAATKHLILGASSVLNVYGTLDLEGSDSLIGIHPGAQLRIHNSGTSTINGTIEFRNPGEPVGEEGPCDGSPRGYIEIGDEHVFEGDGGLIIGRTCSDWDELIPGTIRCISQLGECVSHHLTLRTEGQSPPLVVKGTLDISARVTNEDGTMVMTDEDEDLLRLLENDKDGDGAWWVCQRGTFIVDATVTGTSDWDMSGASATALMQFIKPNACISGDFLINDGRVEFYENTCFNGGLDVDPQSGLKNPKIWVESGNAVSFAGDCICSSQ
jgi:hypothetical protein